MSVISASQQASDRSFRRGAIMGLTIAESFILLVFCLLLLFALWQFNSVQVEQQRQISESDPEAVELAVKLRADGTIDAVMELRAKGIDLREFSGFAEADKFIRFLSEPELRRLMNGAAKLKAADIATLSNAAEVPASIPNLDLLSDKALLDALEMFANLSEDKREAFLEAATEDGLAALTALKDAGLSPDDPGFDKAADFVAKNADDPALIDLVAALATLPAETRSSLIKLGKSGNLAAITADVDLLDRLSEAEGALRGISSALVEAAEAEAQLAAGLRETLGGIVAQVDGQILDDGSIVLPEDVVFSQGSSEILPKLKNFLSQACPPWMDLLRNSGLDIGSAEIQGHASREWRQGTPDDLAYRNNLQLSQERARNVLNYCLQQVTDTETSAWSREHAIAVGYSSSRPVVVEKEINDQLSRRVVFSIELDRKKLLDAVGKESSTTLTSSMKPGEKFQGDARVIDGDTLEIDGLNVRIFGIDAPERKQTCLDQNGSEFGCGEQAKATLARIIGGRQVTCVHENADFFGRSVSTCQVDGMDLGEAMVVAGEAMAYLKYSNVYESAEAKSRQLLSGFWNGQFVPPWEYR